MNALQQFLQAASNEAAGAVSGPVDLIGMGLRKLGVPVPRNALMSSDWMRQNGLMQDVPQNAASLAGQTFGLLSPVVAAAKAPQIARGLLNTADDFQRYNQALGPAGVSQATVWHGSPHKFDKFDSSKIGTGEGAQAYGHGLYLAESPDVARGYQRDLSTKVAVDGKPLLVNNQRFGAGLGNSDIEDYLVAHNGDLEGAIKSAVKDMRYVGPKGDRSDMWETLNGLKGLRGKVSTTMDGSLYKVDLPDEKIARMLDWDKPLSQQAPDVRAAVDKIKAELTGPFSADMNGDQLLRHIQSTLRGIGRGSDKAEGLLRQQGIPGIRYLDGGSRTAGAGSSNFVVFPGEENALRILERNGKPIR